MPKGWETFGLGNDRTVLIKAPLICRVFLFLTIRGLSGGHGIGFARLLEAETALSYNNLEGGDVRTRIGTSLLQLGDESGSASLFNLKLRTRKCCTGNSCRV